MSCKDILCVDMDAFFVSVEQAYNPNLRGKCVAVTGAKERSVILTSSYEARKKGVRTGMNYYEAINVCPQLIVIPAAARKYTAVSRGIAEILHSVSPESAMYSVDEAFVDISGTGLTADSAAYMIKSKIRKAYGINCTVGAGPNRLIAKMATTVNKPDGYYKVTPEHVIAFIDSFKLSDIWGIGRRSASKFSSMGLYTPHDLREFGEVKLENMLGIPGKILYRLVSGMSESSIPKYDADMKSVGHSMTLPSDISSREDATPYLLQLSEMVSSRARSHNYSGRTVTLAVRFSDMSTYSFRRTITFRTSATHHIYENAVSLFDMNIKFSMPVRLLGVTLSSLDHLGSTYANVEDFLSERTAEKKRLYDAIDAINAKFGDRAVSYASVLKCRRKGSSVIAPSWRPDGERNFNLENV